MSIKIKPEYIFGGIVVVFIIIFVINGINSAINSAREEGKEEGKEKGIKEGELIDKCSTGTVLNTESNKCEIVSCTGIDKPVFNEFTKNCEACPDGTKFLNGKCVVDTCINSQVFNDTTNSCEACPVGTKYEGGKCVVDTCSNPQVFNDTTNSCEDCPVGTEYEGGKCVLRKCVEPQVFNYSTKECEACPTGTQYVNGVCDGIVCIQGKQLVGNICEDIICVQGEELVVNSCLPVCGIDEYRLGVDCVVSYMDETFPPIVAARALNPDGDLDLSMYKAVKIAPDFLTTVDGKYSNFSTIMLPTIIGEDTIFTNFLEGNTNLNFVTEQLSRDFFKPFAKLKGFANVSFATKTNWVNSGFQVLDFSPLENLEFLYVNSSQGWFVNTDSITKLKEVVWPPTKIKTFMGNMFSSFNNGNSIEIVDFSTCTAEFDLDHFNLYNSFTPNYNNATIFGCQGTGNTTLREVRGNLGGFINSYLYSLIAAGLGSIQYPRMFDNRKGIEVIEDLTWLQTCNLQSTSFNQTKKLKSFDTNVNVIDENGNTVPLTYPQNMIVNGTFCIDSMVEMEVLNLAAFRNITYFGSSGVKMFLLPSSTAGMVPFTQDVDFSSLKKLNQTIPSNFDIANNLKPKFDLALDGNGYPVYKIKIPNVDELNENGTHYPGAILANYFLNYYPSSPSNAPGDICYYVCQENGQYITKQTYQETV